MKLTDFLSDVGRPVAYYPGLRRVTGSTTATILLCQLIYWTGKESRGDGWIYKSADDLEQETGLSYDEQRTAREKLVSAGIIKEQYKRLEHKMYFQVQTEALNALWEIPEMGNAKMGNMETPNSTKSTLPNSLIGNTENTTENTTEINNEPENFKKALSAYSNNIAMLTPVSSETLLDMCKSYTSDWVIDAIKIAVERNARNLKYIAAILQSWKEKGKNWKPGAKNANTNNSANQKPVIEQNQPTDADRQLAAQIRAARGMPTVPGD